MNKSYKAKAHSVLFRVMTTYSLVYWYRRLAAT